MAGESKGASPAGSQPRAGFELRLEQGKAFVCLSDRPVAPGLRLVHLALEVPEARFPFDPSRGAGQFRLQLCDLSRLELAAEAGLLEALVPRLDLAGAGVASLELSLRPGFAEGAGALVGGAPFSFRVSVEPCGEQEVAIAVYEPRTYALAPVPSAALPSLLARSAAALGRAAGGEVRVDALSPVLLKLLPARGWKVPRVQAARLALARVGASEVRLAWDRAHSGPPEGTLDPDRLAGVEGARAFRDAESLLERGQFAEARNAWLAQGGAAQSHPFGAARLLSLLTADERFHDEALDLAAQWLSRRPDFAPALCAEAVIRAHRGERTKAARAFAELASAASRRGEQLGALLAAEACYAAAGEEAPGSVARAGEVALQVRPDHLPSLRALLALAERTGDREGVLRACRRLAAVAADDVERARAHARLAALLLGVDPPAARLHLDQALRLAPDDASALRALARACEEAGESLRAARAHDRLREVLAARGEAAAAAEEALAVGALWEERLGHPENALLRYREVAELVPGTPAAREARLRAARLADSLGHRAEAADHWHALLQLLDPADPEARSLSARAHRALAEVAGGYLKDPAAAAAHLEAALSDDPSDPASLTRLAALYRELGQPAELLDVLDRLAPTVKDGGARAALLSEAGELCLGPLSLPDEARERFSAALFSDPASRPAMEGLARAAARLGDAGAEAEALARLAASASDPTQGAALRDRAALALERQGDVAGALAAGEEARRAEPSARRLAESVRRARLAGDSKALAGLLLEVAERARDAEDTFAAAEAFLERATLLGPEEPELALESLAQARSIAPGEARLLRAEADLAEGAGKPARALAAVRALLATAGPEGGALEARAARLSRAAGEAAAAVGHAARARDAGAPGAAALYLELVEGSGDPALQAALREEQERFAEAAELWTRAGSPERALAALRRAGLAAPGPALAPTGPGEPPPRPAPAAEAPPPAGEPAAAPAPASRARGQDQDPVVLDELAASAHATGDAGAEARALLERASLAAERGEADAPLRLALAGEAALEASLPVEAEAALRRALHLGLERDEARDAWGALLRLAREHRDEAAERSALAGLVHLAPTGERTGLLLRLSALELAAGDVAAARRSAEEARTLAPKDLAAAEACLEAARREGDSSAVAELLSHLAPLDPARAGDRLLERARLLAGPLGRPDEADRAYREALARLPADRGLAEEHVRVRKGSPAPVGALPWGQPLEAFAARSTDPEEASLALRESARLARSQGDRGAALRAARAAHARGADPAFDGETLAALLHSGGSLEEALAVHVALLDGGLSALDEGEAVDRLFALAQLAEESGNSELAVSALDRLLELRPHDADAVEWRFRVDPDRGRALRHLAEGARQLRSRRRRARALLSGARAARAEAGDAALARALLGEAREACDGLALARREVEELRLAAVRELDLSAPAAVDELVEALHDASGARAAAGDDQGARAALEEAVGLALRNGRVSDAAAGMRALEEQAAARGDVAGANELSRRVAMALFEAGDAESAERALRRAVSRQPGDSRAWEDLERLALSRRDAGAPLLAEVLGARAERSQGAERAAALVSLSRVFAGPLSDPERALTALRAALAATPGDASAEAEMERMLASLGRGEELGQALLERAARAGDPDERARLVLRAAEVLRDSGGERAQALAAQGLLSVLAAPPRARAALLEASARLVALGRGGEATSYLLALCRADPLDTATAQALVQALGDRHRERADAFLEIAAAASAPEVRAVHLREAARALEAGGDAARAREVMLQAFEASPADDDGFRAALADAAGEVERMDSVLSARARAVPDEATGCHRARADLLLAAGRPEAAAQAYEECLAIAPADSIALAGLTEARAAQGDGAGALAVARRRADLGAAAGLADERRMALESGGRIAARFGDRGEDAAALLESLAALHLGGDREGDPEAEPLLDRAVSALVRAGESLRASSLLALGARNATGSRRAELLWQLSVVAEARGDASAARAARAESLTAETDPRRRAERLADIRQRREPVSYARALEQVLGAGEEGAELWLELGRAKVAASDLDGAAAAFEQVVRRGAGTPGYEEALRELESAHVRRGDDRAVAADHARRAEAASDGGTRAQEWLLSAQALDRAGDVAGARRALEQACQADPDEAPSWQALAALEERHGDPLAAARAHLAVAIRSQGTEAEGAALAAAHIFEDRGEEAEAQRAWAAAALARPGSWHAHKKLAEASSRRGDAAAAVAHLESASREEVPESEAPEYLRALGRALDAAGRPAEAVPAWRELFSREPGDAEAFQRVSELVRSQGRLDEWVELASRHEAAIAGDQGRRLYLRRERARVFSAQGRHEAAAGAWRAALEIDPDDPESLAGLAALAAGAAAETVPEPAPPPAAAGGAAPAPDMGYSAAGEPTPLEAGLAAISPEVAAAPSPLEVAREAARREPSNPELQDAWAEQAALSDQAEEEVVAWQAALAAGDDRPAEAGRRGRALARALEGLGRTEEAVAALERARAAAPWDDGVEADLSRLLLASARALVAQGQSEAAYARLKLARQLDPGHAELTLSLARIAEKLGHLEESVALGEVYADSVAAADPAAAATRYRELAEALGDRLSDPDRAIVLLEKAVSLAPHDEAAAAALRKVLVRRRERALKALEGHLEAARRRPSDVEALLSVAALCREMGVREPDAKARSAMLERASVAELLARFFEPGLPAPAPPSLATRVTPEARSRVASPGSETPTGRLLSLLAPYLEPLFPVDLSRYAVGPADRVSSASAPALHALAESASRALAARPVAVFLSRQESVFAAVENTQPPSLVVGSGAVALGQGALAFLVTRALALSGVGWTLIGKFAPRDVLILCELASRFAGGEPPGLGLPTQRAGAFLSALERSVPASVRSWAGPLGPASAEELRLGFDSAAFGSALERSAGRVALLHAGDPHGALTALWRLERPDEPPAKDPVAALERPELSDLARFALSDVYLELRSMLLGW